MSDHRVTTKAELLDAIDSVWPALNAAIDRLTEAQLATHHDGQGWTIKDHLIHLTAWERSVVFFLQGKPREEGLGVPSSVYLQGNDDKINAVIYQRCHELPVVEAVAQFRVVHQELMQLLQPLTDEDLQRPYRYYLPHEPGEGDGRPAINVIYGNTAHHFREHLACIEALANT